MIKQRNKNYLTDKIARGVLVGGRFYRIKKQEIKRNFPKQILHTVFNILDDCKNYDDTI